MPYIDLKTNAPFTNDTAEQITELLGREIELIPGKTERWLMTNLAYSDNMAFAGTSEPCAIAEVSLFGSASEEAYAALTSSLCEKLSLALGVPADRIYVKYEEVSVWGWNGANF